MKKLLLPLIGLSMALSSLGQSRQAPMMAVYNCPAVSWEEEALPLGNGFMGAMVFGGVDHERIQVNEKCLWSGGPGEDSGYNGGHLHSHESVVMALQDFRNALQKNMIEFSKTSVPNAPGNYMENSAYYDNNAGFDGITIRDSILTG